MSVLGNLYKLSLGTMVLLLGTFVVGLLRGMMDAGRIDPHMSEGTLYVHIAFALITGVLSLTLLSMAYRSGLTFPKVVATLNIAVISMAGFSGVLYLLLVNQIFTIVMLNSFEISFGLSSMLVGYFYCFLKKV